MSAEKVITERCEYLRSTLEVRGVGSNDIDVCLEHIKNAILDGYHQGQIDYSTDVLPELLRMATVGKF
ncbi:hypothetical protein INT55_0052 [Salmonella phage INT55]|nr:hypothetical protein INT55_0052 [Salmonella phage INT55]WAQ79702.1 hypothetical protein INT59_0051 [Salmonella phage INT59]